MHTPQEASSRGNGYLQAGSGTVHFLIINPIEYVDFCKFFLAHICSAGRQLLYCVLQIWNIIDVKVSTLYVFWNRGL